MKWNHQPASYNSLTPHFYFILLILVLSGIPSSGTFTVSGPLVQPIRAWVGKDVQLSCHLSPKFDVQGMTVKWVRGPLVVHLYRMGQEMEEVQAPAFQGRTKMLREEMAEGKVTVIIHQVKLSDTGQYTCYFQEGFFYNETSFELQVAERQKGAFSVTGPAQLIQAKQGEDVTLSCELSPKRVAHNVTVNWFRNQTLVHSFSTGEKLEESQGTELQGRVELLKHDMAEGKVTLKIQDVQVSDSGLYTCHVQSADNYDEAHIELQVAGRSCVVYEFLLNHRLLEREVTLKSQNKTHLTNEESGTQREEGLCTGSYNLEMSRLRIRPSSSHSRSGRFLFPDPCLGSSMHEITGFEKGTNSLWEVNLNSWFQFSSLPQILQAWSFPLEDGGGLPSVLELKNGDDFILPLKDVKPQLALKSHILSDV